MMPSRYRLCISSTEVVESGMNMIQLHLIEKLVILT